MNKYQITQQGFDKLQKELSQLEEVQRPKIVEKLKKAREKGDLSENSEYTTAKESLRFIDERIVLLKEQLEQVEIISDSSDKNVIEIGDTVTVKTNDTIMTYTIVGELEADLSKNKLSSTSPIGKALLGHSIGKLVEVDAPAGKITYNIIEIK